MELLGVQYIRVALTPEQVAAYELPSDPAAVKLTDRRLKAYVRRFGMVAVELDALHPQALQEMAVEAIESQFDMDLFMEHREVERQELARLAAIKAKVMAEFNSMTSQT